MSAKHTPGPWRANSSWIEAPQMALRVAAVDWPKRGTAPKSEAEAKANAAMIAAAPEMYDALCRLISSCEKLDAFNKPHNMLSIDRLNRARAAIAKAEGAA